MKILFVCTGNMCRSPMCELLAREILGKRSSTYVDSCGVSEKSADLSLFPKRLKELMQNNGYKVKAVTRSKRVNSKLIGWADYLVYMQPSHREALSNLGVPDEKLIFLGRYAKETVTRIPDPAFIHDKDEMQKVFELIESCTKRLIRDTRL